MTPTKMIAEMLTDTRISEVAIEMSSGTYCVTLRASVLGCYGDFECYGDVLDDSITEAYDEWRKAKGERKADMTPIEMIAEMVADEKYNAVVVERWFDDYVVTLGYFHQGEIDGVEHKGKTIADAIAAMYEAWQKSKA